MRFPSRAEIRQLAADHFREMTDVAAAGGNAHQTAIDQSDKLAAFAHALGDEQGPAFLQLYQQEMEAISRFALEQSERELARAQARRQAALEERAQRDASYSYLNPRPLEEQSLGERIGRGLVAGLIVVFLMWLFMR